MLRKIIKIDEAKCNGCGACATACHEGAIEIIDGIAKLTREHYCDGLGDCLPACPMDAISFEQREAPAYDEAAVLASKQKKLYKKPIFNFKTHQIKMTHQQWPIQLKLMPITAPYYQNANLLIAADCTAFIYPNFHQEFLKDNVLVIGCPKLDQIDYSEKLSEMIKNNSIKKITLVRMEIPCCSGLEKAIQNAISISQKETPLSIVVINTNGQIIYQ